MGLLLGTILGGSDQQWVPTTHRAIEGTTLLVLPPLEALHPLYVLPCLPTSRPLR